MGYVHANTEAVPFDFESAEALKTHLTHLTQVIEHQLPARYGTDGTCGAAQLALEGFTGGYARVYRAKLASSFALLREFKECFSNAARTFVLPAKKNASAERLLNGRSSTNVSKELVIVRGLSMTFIKAGIVSMTSILSFLLVLCLPTLRILRSTRPAL